jgi:hypothetical protein
MRTFASVLFLLLAACSKDPATTPPAPLVHADPRPVPLSADGWPLAWPEAGVMYRGDYIPGRVVDPSKAVVWTPADATPENMALMEQALRRGYSEHSVIIED